MARMRRTRWWHSLAGWLSGSAPSDGVPDAASPEAPPCGAESGVWRWWAGLGWLGVGVVVFSLGFFPLRTSTDEWWHLKTGRWIVEHGWRPPAKDIFTYTAADFEWHNHEWLSQVGMYQLWRWGEERVIGGWRAVILAKALVLVAAYLLLGRFLAQRAGGGALGAAITILLTLVAAAGRRMFWPRPPIISNLLFVFFLYALWLHRTGRLRTPWLLALAMLMPLWANLHGGFLLGGIAVAAYCAGEALEWGGCRLVARQGSAELRPKLERVGVYAGLGVLCGLASLANPYGHKLYLLPGRVMDSKRLLGRLGEMAPPDFRYTWAYGFLLALVGAGLVVLAARTVRRRGGTWPPVADLLLVGFFFWQSIHHMRHMMLFGLVGAPLAAWMLGRWARSLGVMGSQRFVRVLSACSLTAGLWLVFFPGEAIHTLPAMWRVPRTATRGETDEASPSQLGPSQFDRNRQLLREEFAPDAYPVQAVDFILRAKLPPRMFNRNNSAGYLIWALSPEHYKVFTDSRFDVFGETFLADEESVVAGGTPEEVEQYYKHVKDPMAGLRPWLEVVGQYGINWLFVDRSEIINRRLAQPDSGWALVYLDGAWRIWLRETPENSPWVERYADPRLLATLRRQLRAEAARHAAGNI